VTLLQVPACNEVLDGVFNKDLFLGMPCCLMACSFCSIMVALCCFAISVVSTSCTAPVPSSKSKLPLVATAIKLFLLASHFSANLSIDPWMSDDPDVKDPDANFSGFWRKLEKVENVDWAKLATLSVKSAPTCW
jgi:hypothetical protein